MTKAVLAGVAVLLSSMAPLVASVRSVRPLTVEYDHELNLSGVSREFDLGLVEPTALVAGDFDEDGVQDLVCGYRGANGGFVTLHRGNIDAIYPYNPGAMQRKAEGSFTDAPFLPAVRIFSLPVSPSFLGVGDYDNDGHLDVVAAARGKNLLHFLVGNGEGELQETRRLKLDGGVTSMVSGEVDYPDGLADLVVAVEGERPSVIVFDGPRGVLKSSPESFELQTPARTLALGDLNGDGMFDIALAQGSELLVIRGRDRHGKLVWPQGTPPALVTETIALPSPVAAVGAGDFVVEPNTRVELVLVLDDGSLQLLKRSGEGAWTPGDERALGSFGASGGSIRSIVAVRMGAKPNRSPVFLGDTVHRLHWMPSQQILRSVSELELGGNETAHLAAVDLPGTPVAVLPMRLNGDALEDLVVLVEGTRAPMTMTSSYAATITVTSSQDNVTAGDGSCTLREAITNANADSDTTAGDCAAGSGNDTILFSIGSGLKFIGLSSALPEITDTVTIDGTSQPGFVGVPLIVVNGAIAASAVWGVGIAADSTTIRGMVVGNFTNASGIRIRSSNCIVEGNYIGISFTGASTFSNGVDGVEVSSISSGNTIGGTAGSLSRNVISANGSDGVHFRDGARSAVVQGNYIGTNAAGTFALGNGVNAVHIDNTLDHLIGGVNPGTGNVLSGNFWQGVRITGSNALLNSVRGNYIGTTSDGQSDLGNVSAGVVLVFDADSNSIGSSAAGARNVISGSTTSSGVFVGADAIFNGIHGNFIGTDADGDTALENFHSGVYIENSLFTSVGSSLPGGGNIISGNRNHGVELGVGARNTEIHGNYIGTDVTGAVALGNGLDGVRIDSALNNDVGGFSGEGNVISANDNDGVALIGGAAGNRVLGNFIGTDATGKLPMGNAIGVRIDDAPNNTVGLNNPNVISGNSEGGVAIARPAATGNFVSRNFVGTNPSGDDLGNTVYGVFLFEVSDNTIGGTGLGDGNTIAYNGEGVGMFGSSVDPVENRVLGNSIHSNTNLGIELFEPSFAPGVTPNDLQDPDIGPNQFQNYPVLTAAAVDLPNTSISGSLNSLLSTQFRLEFFGGLTCDGSGFGEGKNFIGFLDVTTNGTGDAGFAASLPTHPSGGNVITATATDPVGNTSEFSACVTASCLTLLAFGPPISAPDKDTLSWGMPEDVHFAKGDLASVSSYTTLTDGPLMNAASLDISGDNPGTGAGLYYLVKYLGCGSWQNAPAVPSEPGRDSTLP